MRRDRKLQRRKERMNMTTGLAILGVLLVLCVLNLVARSGMENLSGQVTGSVNVAFGQRETDGIYLGEDHQLLAEVAKIDESQVARSMSAINQFAYSRSDISFYLALVPSPAAILSDKLPANAEIVDEKEQFEEIKGQVGKRLTYVDLWDVLQEHKEDDVYYKTENLWTTKGSYYGFETLASSMVLNLDNMPELAAYAVSADFNGSLSKESGFEKNYVEPIYFYAARNSDEEATVLVESDTKTTATLYDAEALETDEQLNLFLGGDKGYLDIHTLSGGNRKLLLVKDTYANSMVPFLAYFFQEIVVVDSDHYSGSAKEILREKDITDVLFLYGGDDFVTTDSICKVLDYDASE